MKRTNKIDDGPDGGCLSTIECCRKAAAYCYKRAAMAWGDKDRDHWRRLASRNQQRAAVAVGLWGEA